MVFPLAGRSLPAAELLVMAKSSLRCIDWSNMSFDLMRSSTVCGRVDGKSAFELSRAVTSHEKIDFFLSHSWHDDAMQKWLHLERIADMFFQEHGRYPTFWLDKVSASSGPRWAMTGHINALPE